MTRLPASISSPAATSPATPPPITIASASMFVPKCPLWWTAGNVTRLQARRAGTGFFRLLYESHDTLRHRCYRADPFGKRQNCTLQIIDLGDTALQQILPHRRARLRVNGQHPPRHQAKEPIGQAQNERDRPRRHTLDSTRANARGPEHRECLIDLCREQAPPAAIGKLLRKWHAAKRVESIVEVKDQLAPQHRGHVAMLLHWRTRDV